MKHSMRTLWGTLVLVTAFALINSLAAATITVQQFGDNGWKADDTRTGAGVDLVGLNYTHAGKPGQTPTLADDALIAQQIKFVTAPAGATYSGAAQIIAPVGNPGKSTISVIDDVTGFAPTDDLVGGSFSATYSWYMDPNPTARTLAFRFGIQSTRWGTGLLQSQNGFTAIRSGESVWDLVLVHVPASSDSNAWNPVSVDMNTGLWYLYGQAGNSNWLALEGANPPGGTVSKTLAGWQADPTWGSVIFGTGAKISSIQFGLGSGQQSCIAYVDYLQTTVYNGGDVVDFIGPIKNLNTGETFGTIQDAIDDAQTLAGHTIEVSPGTYVLSSTVNVNKGVTIDGYGPGQTIIQVAQPVGYAFSISATGATLRDIELQKTDVTGVHNLILILASNVAILNNLIYGPDPGSTWSSNGIVSRALEVAGGLTGVLIDNNTIRHLRQPAYMNTSTITVSNNAVSGTRGWVVDGSTVTFTNNSWPLPLNQGSEIALLPSCTPAQYPNLLAISNANNNAYIDAQFSPTDKGRAVAHVNAAASAGGFGNSVAPYQLVSAGVANVLTGGQVLAVAGNYLDDVTIAKAMTVTGAGIDQSYLTGLKTGANSATVRISTAAPTVVEGFTITREGNNVTDWATNVKLIGFAVQGSAGNAELRNCKLTGNRSAIDLNFTSGNNIHNNVIDFNRTGLILRNQCTNNTIEENDITNNWTDGVLWLLASTEDATGTKFFNNKIEGNWYCQIENRSTTGGVKNFSGNWLGGTALTTANTNGSEPGYAAQIPVAYGGTATPPGGALSVRGVGIADMDYTPWLGSGTDTDVDNGSGTIGFQGDYSTLYVDDDNGQSGTVNRVQEAVNMVSGSTIYLMPGIFVGQVVIDSFFDIFLDGAGVGLTTIQATASMPGSFLTGSNTNKPIVMITNTSNAQLLDMTVDGAGLGNTNYRFIGVAYRNSGGGMTNVEVKDTRDTPLSGNQHGNGVYVYSNNGTDRTVDLDNVTVTGFQKNGISFIGPDLTAIATNCTVTGNGPMPLGQAAQNGIQFSDVISGTATGNSISNISYVPNAYVACAFLIFAPATVAIDDNEISECQVGAYFIDAAGSFSGNTYLGTQAGMGQEDYFGLYALSQVPAKSNQRQAQPLDADLITSAKFADAAASLAPRALSIIANDNIMDGDDADSSQGIVAYSYTDGNLAFQADGNRLTHFQWGAGSYADPSPITAVFTNNEMLYNDVGFENYGGVVTVTANTFVNPTNATDDTPGNTYDQNCWNDWSGIGTYAVGGGGGNVDNNPRADCALDLTPDNVVYFCSGDFTLDMEIGVAVSALDAANVWFEYPAGLDVSSVTGASPNYFVAYTQSTNPLNTRDTLKVNLGVLTGVQDGPAILFTVAMNGMASCLSSDIQMIYRDLRDSTNTAINVPLAAATTIVTDCVDPDVVVNSPAAGGFYNVVPVLNLSASDDCAIDALYYQIDGCTVGGWLPIATGLSGTVYNNAAWSMTPAEFTGLAEGVHCIRFKVKDDFSRCNADSCSYTWCFTKDITAPLPPTTLVAQPGHNKIQLSWINSASSDVVGVQIQRVPWTDYPDYGSTPTPTSAPAYPADYTIGTNILTQAATTATPGNHLDVLGLSNATRDIYYFGAFAYDAAGNYSVAAVSAQARATSYWLGDVGAPFDGQVYFADLLVFAGSYGVNEGQIGFSKDADFGPTHNNSPKGIPLPDDKVEFEDLAIFAINFDDVSPAAKTRPTLAEERSFDFANIALIERATADGYFIDMYAMNPNADVKSLLGEVSYDPRQMKLVSVTPSEALMANATPIFFKTLESERAVSVSVAALGSGVAFSGSGIVATLQFQQRAAVVSRPALTRIELRDNENRSLAPEIQTEFNPAPGLTSLPTEYAVDQNTPNPFNPDTKISFALPKSTNVRVEVYNVVGQLVKTLVDGYLPAGRHEVIWNGTNEAEALVASGIYFYRFETADFTKTVKMMLMK